MITTLDWPWQDERFLAAVRNYEHELRATVPSYPVGRTVSFLDVDGIRTLIAIEDGHSLGFIVVGIEPAHVDIHELYVVPGRRSGVIARALWEAAVQLGTRLVFNIFKMNHRAMTLADKTLSKTCASVVKRPASVWSVACVHYEATVKPAPTHEPAD